jgi:large subunit ribosomal protein L18
MYKKMTGRERRKQRVRKKVFGTSDRPRMSVFRSLKNISVQVIDDETSKTLASASSCEGDFKETSGKKRDAAKVIGEAVAQRAMSKGITTIVFDRNGCKYHGRIKALAEAAREKGLKF